MSKDHPMLLFSSLIFGLGLVAQAKAGIQTPSGAVQPTADIAVSLSASQMSNLQRGQDVTFTVTVTNNGPDVLKRFGVISSPLYPEQIDLYGMTTDCGVVITSVTDAAYTFWYDVTWVPTDSSYTSAGDLPLAVGESRSCHFTFAIASTAPQAFPLDFHLLSYWHDPNPANDRSRVLLQLVPIVEAAPSLSISASLLLALGFTLAGVRASTRTAGFKRRSRTSARIHA